MSENGYEIKAETLETLRPSEEFLRTLDKSKETIDEINLLFKKIFINKEKASVIEINQLQQRLVIENSKLQYLSVEYKQKYDLNLKLFRDYIRKEHISVNSASLNKVNKMIVELNLFNEEILNILARYPETLQLSLKDKVDLKNFYNLYTNFYSKDEIIKKLNNIEEISSSLNLENEYLKKLDELKQIIDSEKKKRFKIFILNKSLYSVQNKKLEDLDIKWLKRLEILEQELSKLVRLKEDITKIENNVREQEEDDLILKGLGGVDEDEGEGEVEEEEKEKEENEEDEDNEEEREVEQEGEPEGKRDEDEREREDEQEDENDDAANHSVNGDAADVTSRKRKRSELEEEKRDSSTATSDLADENMDTED
ncbi:hypothetical protein PACTADRAFT_77236 [Pachysolen tannophilus NRRL Y-2460]|uniref:Uncharacterized protein n=1 Tax=Pachysolen tannophilus NRRL Y-2460 TaxID=669874 RepID=A0A1E4TPN8_PACTA|nr:hypothetical protein PACTADRAFT_77236 [Pachysolen tannophilus NRRL Y-2460]